MLCRDVKMDLDVFRREWEEHSTGIEERIQKIEETSRATLEVLKQLQKQLTLVTP